MKDLSMINFYPAWLQKTDKNIPLPDWTGQTLSFPDYILTHFSLFSDHESVERHQSRPLMFEEPEKIIQKLSSYIYLNDEKSALKKLIYVEEIDNKIKIELQAKQIVFLFKDLFDRQKTFFTSKKKLSEWIILNFKFLYSDVEYKDFKEDTIQRVLMRNEKPPRNPIIIE